MKKTAGFLVAINLMWFGLSLLFDGVNSLILPHRLATLVAPERAASALGLLTFFGLALGMLAQPLIGLASDRARPRRGRMPLIGAGVLLALAALAWLGVSADLWALAAAYAVLQVGASAAQAGQQALIPDLVAPGQRGAASGVKGLMDIGGATAGFVLLGALLGQGRPELALLAAGAALALTYGFSLLWVKEAPGAPGAPPPPQTTRPTLIQAFRFDYSRHRAFVWVAAARFLFLLATYAVGRFLLLFVAQRLGLPPDDAAQAAGGLLAALALITVIGSPPAGWAADRWGRLPLMTAGALLSALSVALIAAAGSAMHILLAGSLMSLGSALFAGASWAMLADLAPPDEPARFFGLANLASGAAVAAAGLFGPLVDWGNGRTPGLGFTVLFAAAAVVFLLSAAALWKLRGLVRPHNPSQIPVES